MAHQPGEIYFVRERERSGSQSAFVKIGLVRYKDNRDSYARLLEHQTGNPRQLYLNADEIVKTEAVDRVEAQLHRLFAERRVSGEWFEFESDDEVSRAVSLAQELATEMAELSPYFITAEQLKVQTSTDGKRAATEHELALGLELLVAKECLVRIRALESRIRVLLERAFKEGDDISHVATKTTRAFKPAFLVKEFAEAHPDVYKKYMVVTEKWQQAFLQKQKWSEDSKLPEPLVSELEIYEAHILEAEGAHRSKLPILNESVLGLTRLAGEYNWNKDISEARLKCSMALYEEIVGVATWKRYLNSSLNFDEELFATENPELAKEFVSTPEPKTYVAAKKKKA